MERVTALARSPVVVASYTAKVPAGEGMGVAVAVGVAVATAVGVAAGFDPPPQAPAAAPASASASAIPRTIHLIRPIANPHTSPDEHTHPNVPPARVTPATDEHRGEHTQ